MIGDNDEMGEHAHAFGQRSRDQEGERRQAGRRSPESAADEVRSGENLSTK